MLGGMGGAQGDTLLLLLLSSCPPATIPHFPRTARCTLGMGGSQSPESCALQGCRVAGTHPTEYCKARGKEKEGRGTCDPTFLALNLLLSVPPTCWERECLPCLIHIQAAAGVSCTQQGPAALGARWSPLGAVPILTALHPCTSSPCLCLPLSL